LPLFSILIVAFWNKRVKLRLLLAFNSGEGTLYHHGLQISTCLCNPDRFLFAGRFIVERGKPAPRAKICLVCALSEVKGMMKFMKTNSIFNAIKHGILICNAQGCIVFFNHIYGEFIGHSLREAKNLPITDIRPGSRVPEVLKFKRPVENILRNENGQEYFASIYPIIENDIVYGTISLVTTIGQIEEHVSKDARSLYERTREFEKQEILRTVAMYGNTLEGKKKAAETLGISLASLYNKLKN